MNVVWLPRASNDLAQIRAYIARDDPRAAQAIVRRIAAAVDTLADFPRLGRATTVPGTREMTVPRTPYRVAYRLREQTIEVMRVVHGAQRPLLLE